MQTVNEYFTANVATQTECQSDATDQVFQKESVGVQADEFTYTKKHVSVMTEDVTNIAVPFSIDQIKDNGKAISFYTGFPSFACFLVCFQFLGPAAVNLQYTTKVWKDGCIEGQRRSLSPMNEFFLTLCRIKAGLFEQDLANRFQISQSTVSHIITSWINFMYAKFKEVPTWPSRQVIDRSMPYQFENLYPSTRCIIDATEIYIQMPSNPSAQQLTFSSY